MDKESRTTGKVCKLTNGRLSWLLEVDGMRIPFTGMEVAEYFADHYKKLGYEIIMKDESQTPVMSSQKIAVRINDIVKNLKDRGLDKEASQIKSLFKK